MKPKRAPIRMNARAFATMLRLADGAHSCEEIAEESGLCKLTVYRYLAALHGAKLCHIGGWERDRQGRMAVKLYQMGPGIDQKPQKVSAAESRRRWRTKRKQMLMQDALAGRLAA